MTIEPTSSFCPDPPTGPVTITGPGDLLTSIPWLLGFQPTHSLVLVGLRDTTLIVTARLDLPVDTTPGELVGSTRTRRDDGSRSSLPLLARSIDAMTDAGVTHVVAVVYTDPCQTPAELTTLTPWRSLVDDVAHASRTAGAVVTNRLLVMDSRWLSYDCTDPSCCIKGGVPLTREVTAMQAAAVFAGKTLAPSREALAGLFAPEPRRAHLAPLIRAHEEAMFGTVLADQQGSRMRSATRAVFAAARASHDPRWTPPTADDAARLAAALRLIAVRDAVWLAVDAGRLDGRPLWLDLARRLPDPHRAAPAFLAGWRAWREGDGARARIAADQCLSADSAYTAAAMLVTALDQGIDPRALPKLEQRRACRPGSQPTEVT